MKALSVLKAGASLLLAANLCSCIGIGNSDHSSSNESNDESQSFGDNAQVNQPETNTAAGGSVSVDASNHPDNSTAASDSADQLEGSPCDNALWKPVSESDGNLVIVGASGDVIQWSSVSVTLAAELEAEAAPAEVAKAAEVEFGEFADFTDDGRQVWRFSKPGESYDGEFTIEFSGESCSGSVEDPSARSDAQG